MITILAGGKKPTRDFAPLLAEYEKRLQKPYKVDWIFLPEEKLLQKLENWPFGAQDFVIIADERGQNLSSPEFAKTLETQLASAKNLTLIIGGAYGFPPEIRARANLLWSFSRLVFPHQIARLIALEQIYRAQEIARGSSYHHD